LSVIASEAKQSSLAAMLRFGLANVGLGSAAVLDGAEFCPRAGLLRRARNDGLMLVGTNRGVA
jgi:hypothetical protein